MAQARLLTNVCGTRGLAPRHLGVSHCGMSLLSYRIPQIPRDEAPSGKSGSIASGLTSPFSQPPWCLMHPSSSSLCPPSGPAPVFPPHSENHRVHLAGSKCILFTLFPLFILRKPPCSQPP